MSKRDKLLKKFFAEKPPADITWPELIAVAEMFDCYPIQKSRHRAIVHMTDPKWVFPIPVHSDGEAIKRIYITELREMFRDIHSEVIDHEV